MRWQSTADKTEPFKRERFASPLNVVGMFCAFLFVLVLLYPEQGLLSVLGEGDDAATIRYREALLRIRPGDTALRFSVAGSLVRTGNSRRALEVLSAVPGGLTADQRHSLADMRYRALKDVYARAKPGDAEWLRLRPLFLAAANELAGPKPPAWLLQEIAADARKAGDNDAEQDFSRQAQKNLNKSMAGAVGKFDYRATAGRYFEQMELAGTLSKRRELFFRAVRTLQAGNLPLEALNAGEMHLDGLSSDRATLIFLTRVSLAAGQPARAQRLIRRALDLVVNTQQPESS